MKTKDVNPRTSVSSHAPSSMAESIEFNLIEFVNFVYSRRRGGLIISFLLMGVFIFYSTVIQSPLYKASGTIHINIASKSDSFSMSRLTSWVEEQEMSTKVFTTERFFESSQLRRSAVAEVEGETDNCSGEECQGLKDVIKSAFATQGLIKVEDKVDFMFNHLTINSDSQHYILTITGTHQDPKLSHALATMAIHTLVNLNYQFLLTKNSRVRDFLERQTKLTSEGLAALEINLVNEQKKNNLIGVGETESRMTVIHIEQQQRLHTLQREKNSYDLLEKEIQAGIKDYKAELASKKSASYLYLSQMQKRFDLLKYQMNVESATGRAPAGAVPGASTTEFEQYGKLLGTDRGSWVATDIWDHIKKAELFLVDIRQQREKVISEIQAAQKANAQWSSDYSGIPDTLRKLTDLKRNIQITTDVYTSLKTRLQEINIRDAERANDLAILALPEVPMEPIGLAYGKKVAVAILAGPGITIFILLLGFVLIPLVRNVREVESLGVKVLGSVTRFENSQSLLNTTRFPQIFATNPDSYVANSLRYIRFRLEHELNPTGANDTGKVVTLTSFNSSEGKTFLSVNLASAFAMSGIRVLLVDLDINQSDMKGYFPDEVEEVEIGTENAGASFILKVFSPYVHVLSARSTGSDLRDYIQSREFTTVLGRLRRNYNYVFFDTPPLNGNVEGYLLSGISDATVFVINHRSTLKEQVAQGVGNLRQVNQENLFSILNFTYEDIKIFKLRKRLVG